MKKNILILLSALFVLSTSLEAKQKRNNKDNTVTFYFTRHGKTMLNTLDKVQGWADSPLTAEGVEVAEYLGEGLKAENIIFDAAYSSDLGRARETARTVLNTKGQTDMELVEVPQIRETNFGSYEGDKNHVMWNDAALYLHYKSDKELFDALVKNPTLIVDAMGAFKELETMGVGENYYDVKTRGQKVIKEIAEKEAANGGGNILIVGHGMSLGVFLSDIDSNGKKPSSSHMGNAAVCKVIYKDGKFTLESFGDMSYIEKGKTVSKK